MSVLQPWLTIQQGGRSAADGHVGIALAGNPLQACELAEGTYETMALFAIGLQVALNAVGLVGVVWTVTPVGDGITISVAGVGGNVDLAWTDLEVSEYAGFDLPIYSNFASITSDGYPAGRITPVTPADIVEYWDEPIRSPHQAHDGRTRALSFARRQGQTMVWVFRRDEYLHAALVLRRILSGNPFSASLGASNIAFSWTATGWYLRRRLALVSPDSVIDFAARQTYLTDIYRSVTLDAVEVT